MRNTRLRLVGALALLTTLCAGCETERDGHEHAEDHPDGHDHHAEGHGHFDGPVVSITSWSESLELFAEHPPAVAGQEVSLLMHVTGLDGFVAPSQASAALELTGPAKVTATADAPVRPGIFRLSVTAPTPGEYVGTLRISGELEGSLERIPFVVYATAEAAEAAVDADDDDEGLIEFLKEQQWGVPFGTEFAVRGSLVPSVVVAGHVGTPPGGSAEVGAPITGRLAVPSGGLVHPGAEVRKGQLLATLLPAPSSPEDGTRASLRVAEAEARSAAAHAALERARRLLANEAIPKLELEEAEREDRVAREGLQAARNAASLHSGGSSGGSFRLTAPISGTVTSVKATPGATVSPGEELFHIVDTRVLWINARVPEQEAARVRGDHDASFRVAGTERWRPITVSGEASTATLVSIGRTVDATSRTVDVIFALRKPDPALRVRGLVEVSLPTGAPVPGIVIPRAALIDQNGRSVVYVQVDGEHFEERLVRTVARSGDRAVVSAGLVSGERIVTVGAHLVRLAERAAGPQAHGHIH